MTPYLRVANVYDGRIDYTDVLEMNFSPAERERYLIRQGDILLNEGQSLELVGRCALYDGPENQYCFQNTLVRFRTRPLLDPRFARAVFKRWLDIGRFMTIAKQTTSMAHLGADRFARLDFPLPPIAEQHGIAEVLDTLDEAILKTEQLVAKLKQMKQGLLHDLLTRGIGENGELRDPERHPEMFTDSPLGQIPKAWNLLRLGDVVPRVTYGISTSLGSDTTGVPVLRMNNLKHGEVDISELKYSTSSAAHRLPLRPGDILFNRTNSIDHVGRTGIWRGQIELTSFASYLVRLDPDPEQLYNEFLNRWLNWNCTQTRIRQYATPGVHQVNINPTNLRKTTIALPASMSEQVTIVESLAMHDAAIAAHKQELAKLRLLKQGLMDDLLTGKVRVTPLLNEPTP